MEKRGERARRPASENTAQKAYAFQKWNETNGTKSMAARRPASTLKSLAFRCTNTDQPTTQKLRKEK